MTTTLVFKLLSIAVTIFTAVASADAIAPGQTHVKYQCTGTILCSTVGNQCTISAPNPCKVIVQQNGTAIAATGWDHNCIIRLTMLGTVPIPTSKIIPPNCTIIN